jgi:hypothetical protein
MNRTNIKTNKTMIYASWVTSWVNEVTDAGLRRYWPDGITRIVFTVNNPKTKGKNEVVITEGKR